MQASCHTRKPSIPSAKQQHSPSAAAVAAAALHGNAAAAISTTTTTSAGCAAAGAPFRKHLPPPAAIRIEGGSVGFQIGVSSTDVVMLVMNERGMQKLSSSKFTIGADASAAAGPVGRNAAAQTDAYMHAEILSWSRSKGLFAGVSLDGATLRNDLDENEALYGQRWTSKQILGSGATMPAAASRLIAELNKYSLREQK